MARRVERPKPSGAHPKAEITTACAGLTGGECSCLSGAFSLCWNLDGRLAGILESAEEIAATATAPATRADAERLVYMVSQELPDYRTRGLRNAALLVALDIGRTAERLQVKQFEPEVRRGRGTGNGRKTVAKKSPDSATSRPRQVPGRKIPKSK